MLATAGNEIHQEVPVPPSVHSLFTQPGSDKMLTYYRKRTPAFYVSRYQSFCNCIAR